MPSRYFNHFYNGIAKGTSSIDQPRLNASRLKKPEMPPQDGEVNAQVTTRNAHVDDDPLAKVMIVRYGLEVRDACVLGVGVRPILVLAAEFWQRSARRKSESVARKTSLAPLASKLAYTLVHIYIHRAQQVHIQTEKKKQHCTSYIHTWSVRKRETRLRYLCTSSPYTKLFS